MFYMINKDKSIKIWWFMISNTSTFVLVHIKILLFYLIKYSSLLFSNFESTIAYLTSTHFAGNRLFKFIVLNTWYDRTFPFQRSQFLFLNWKFIPWDNVDCWILRVATLTGLTNIIIALIWHFFVVKWKVIFFISHV